LLIKNVLLSSVPSLSSRTNPVDVNNDITSSDADEAENDSEEDLDFSNRSESNDATIEPVSSPIHQASHTHPIESDAGTHLLPVPRPHQPDQSGIDLIAAPDTGNLPPAPPTNSSATVPTSTRPVRTASRRRSNFLDDDRTCADCRLTILEVDFLHCDGPLCTEKVCISNNTNMYRSVNIYLLQVPLVMSRVVGKTGRWMVL
jgi:hypothetical protein